MEEIEIDLADFERESLEWLIKLSVEQDISVNKVFNNLIAAEIERLKDEV